MKYKIFFLMTALLSASMLMAQMEVGPVSGHAMGSAKSGATPVNLFTGTPSVSIPLFNYKNIHGLSAGVSLNYLAGGIRVNETPSPVGLGWHLNVGGVITRSVRGVADDHPSSGYLFSPAIPVDSRSKAGKYNNGCEDGEQDVFQFNFNGRSGSFVIGKDRMITVMPSSKIKVKFFPDYEDVIPIGSLDTTQTVISSFVITAEDGVKYHFESCEYQYAETVVCDYAGAVLSLKKYQYATAWYLTKILAPFNNSAIIFRYSNIRNHVQSETWNQTDIVRGGILYSDSANAQSPSTGVSAKVPSEIIFPDSTKISFQYSAQGQFRYLTYPVLQRIKYSDSLFRYGYQFDWDTTAVGVFKRDFLAGLHYYTNTNVAPGYKFTYNAPYFPVTWYNDGTNFLNKKDHWGFYNGLNHFKNQVPAIAGIIAGANRTANANALASSLSSVKDPAGGITYYQFENNDVMPTVHTKQSLNISVGGATQTNITLSRLQSPFCSFTVMFNGNTSGSPPLTGSGNMIFCITSLDGLTVYGSDTISMPELFYTRSVSFGFNVPSGNFLLKTIPVGGTVISTAMPVIVSWNNQSAGAGNAEVAGGLRIKQVSHYDSLLNKTDTLATYRYIQPNGKSSGFGGAAPWYHYTRYNSILATNETVVVNDPADVYGYSGGGYTAYKRVEEIKGSVHRNLGKIVHEFTGADEGFVNTDPGSYPYMPVTYNSWAAGLPKRTSVVDSSGRIVQVTTNQFKIDTLVNLNNLSIKYVDHHVTQEYLMGQRSYAFTGRTEIISATDSLYHPDNSVTVSKTQMEYDSNYNIIKLTRDYDKTRGLLLEKRFYYPYNYTVSGALAVLRDSAMFLPVSSENWITGDGNPRLLSAEATEYQVHGPGAGIVLPVKNHSLESNRPVPLSSIGAFNPALLVRNTNYIKPQTESIFDDTGHPLQITNLKTGVSMSNVWGHQFKHQIATVSNAKHTDVAYCGFENRDAGGWTIPSYTPAYTHAFTGSFSYPSGPGAIYKTGLNSALTYTISVWAWTGTSVSLSSGTLLNKDQQNGWVFYTADFSGVSSIHLYVSGGYIDELRLHPADANMISKTFNATGNITSTVDANNTVIYNEYDPINRPLATRDKDKYIISKYEYPDNIISVSILPNWQLDSTMNRIGNPSSPYGTNDGNYRACEVDTAGRKTGRILLKETDMNYYSETYKSYRYVIVETTNTALCPPDTECTGGIHRKIVNGLCETGCKEYISSYHRTIYDPLTDTFSDRWDCTYRYRWSDNSVSVNTYVEYHSSPCFVGPCSQEL